MATEQPLTMLPTRNVVQGKGLAVFDLDGTLLRGDSLLPFLWSYGLEYRRYWGLIRAAGNLGLHLIGLLSARSVKERLLRRVLGDEPLERLQHYAEAFVQTWVKTHFHEVGIAHLREHQDRGDRIILLSASPDIYVGVIARYLGIEEVVCTCVERVEGRCSGRILGENCKGTAKLTKLQAYLGDTVTPDDSYAYGDSNSDLPVLRWVRHGYMISRRGSQRVNPLAEE
jgi:HAD superfamily hydrolase (TIGR01490 family)